MGNQLVGIAPSQIYPVDHYFSGQFGGEIVFDSNMGSTRFFKVARAKFVEGPIVVKVFVKHDVLMTLDDHKERIEYIKKTLANAVNCLPFQRVELTDKAVYIMREYVKHSLYDRVSTRPFLTILEKKWITFQILCALNQCHKQKICHGDIKLENILITSWNWILLSDFASFKPTYLPEDNPADYTYFFDTSRRRTCYIAPERFVKTLSSDDADGNISMFPPTDSIDRSGAYYSGNTLLPAMDIFSAGCALLELWSEGTAPFEFSQLLSYRSGELELVEKHLQGIENMRLRELLTSMIDLNSINRKSAEDYLDQERGCLFPEYFYSFLQSYLQMFSSSPIISPDDKIIRLHSDINHCIKVLTSAQCLNITPEEFEDTDDKQLSSTNNVENEKKDTECCANTSPDQDGLILIINVVTSCIRGLQLSNTKICSLEILQKLSKYTTSETVLDRILPYILYLAQNSSAKVQVQAIETLTACLSMVKDIPRSDANVFPEYILPSITKLAKYDKTSAVIVRVAFARNIAKLAKIAIYFLEETQRNSPDDMPTRRYEAELNALHEIIQQTVLSLLTDPKAVVKQTLIESNICELCAFFGKEKANEVILSHILTFLNDEDKNLRGSFYDNIAGVAGYVGWQVSDILVPLLEQGLADREEFVIAKAIRAFTILIELGHFKKPTITKIISLSAGYLYHPNLWIRHEMCGMIATMARSLSTIDVQCKIMPLIVQFLKIPLIQVERIDMLLDSILPPIPRKVFDSVLRYSDIVEFIEALKERSRVRSTTHTDITPKYGYMGQALSSLFRRLDADGLTEQVEMQLLAMSDVLLKLKSKYPQETNITNGRVYLKDNFYTFQFTSGDKEINTKLAVEPKVSEGVTPTSPDAVVSPGDCLSGSPPSDVIVMSSQATTAATTSLGEYTMPEKNYFQVRSSECFQELESLCIKMKSRYAALALNQRNQFNKYNRQYPKGWRLRGKFITHLHGHSASVIKLTTLTDSFFASASIDGTVCLWDANKISGICGKNQPTRTYTANKPINSIAACDNGQSLAVGCKDGSLITMRIDTSSEELNVHQPFHIDQDKIDGPVVDMHSYEQSSENVIICATLYGGIVAWDTRMQNSVWRLQNDLRHGVITTICADPTGSWLVTATSGGKHICWDLRFRLPITEIKHPSDSWIRKVACHPTESSWLISAAQSNNEVSIWNIETGHRHTVLWASPAPALSYNNSMNDSATTCAILSGVVNDAPFIITGSSDQRLRYWDITQPKKSSLIVPSTNDNLKNVSFNYNSLLIDGSQVIEEQIISLGNVGDTNSLRASTEDNQRSGPEAPSASHHNDITDLLTCKTRDKIYLVSAARDGVIKLWN